MFYQNGPFPEKDHYSHALSGHTCFPDTTVHFYRSSSAPYLRRSLTINLYVNKPASCARTPGRFEAGKKNKIVNNFIVLLIDELM
jgi:hypothetical protein